MSTADLAFEGLVRRVSLGDPGCSALLRRVESSDPDFRMPPGNAPLSGPDRCSIQRWVTEGAKR